MSRRITACSLATRLLPALLLLLFCHSAAAQPKPSSPANDSVRLNDQAAARVARDLYLEATNLLRAGQPEQACTALRAALRLKKAAQIAASLGSCEIRLGRYVEAVKYLVFALEITEKTVGAERRERVFRRLAEATDHVATVSLSTNVSAEVLVDGELIDEPGRKLYLAPGEHTFEARRDGYKPRSRTLELAAGSEREVPLVLTPSAPAAEHAPPDSGPRLVPWILWVGYGVSGVALGLGTGLAMEAIGHDTKADGLLDVIVRERGDAPCHKLVDRACLDIYQLRTDYDSFMNGAIGSYIVAGALGLGTTAYTLYALLATEPGDGPSVTAVPLIFEGGWGLALSAALH